MRDFEQGDGAAAVVVYAGAGFDGVGVGAGEEDVVLIASFSLGDNIVGWEFGDEDVESCSLGGGLGAGDQSEAINAGDHDRWDELGVLATKGSAESTVGVVVNYGTDCSCRASEEGLDGEVAGSSGDEGNFSGEVETSIISLYSY